MMLNTNERFTYTNMRILEIKSKLFQINPNMKDPDALEVINLALVVFCIICDAHVKPELERHDIAQNMIDDKSDFVYYVNDLIAQSNDANDILNEYLEKHMLIKRNEVNE